MGFLDWDCLFTTTSGEKETIWNHSAPGGGAFSEETIFSLVFPSEKTKNAWGSTDTAPIDWNFLRAVSGQAAPIDVDSQTFRKKKIIVDHPGEH